MMLAAGLLATNLTQTSAQNYEQGSKLLNVGIGLGSTFTAAGLNSTLPPIGLSLEYGLTDKISVGGYLGYAGASQEVPTFFGTWKWNYSYIIVGARGSYHFDLGVDKLDPYIGALVGYNVASVTSEKPAGYTGPELTGAAAGGVVIGGHLGARYMFTEKIGAFAELGYGVAYLQLGLAAKF